MINGTSVYPILYDWIAVVGLSISLIAFVWKHGASHPGIMSFLVVQVILVGLFASWSSIFLRTISELPQPLRADQQVYSLAPMVAVMIGTIFNVKSNFDDKKADNHKET